MGGVSTDHLIDDRLLKKEGSVDLLVESFVWKKFKMEAVWPVKSRQISLKVAQKWFH